MTHILENKQLRVEIDEHGAQVMSIYEKTSNTEYLWQGDATYWAGRATLLFPICGRLIEGRYTYKGKSYDMLLHGFIRNVDLTVSAKNITSEEPSISLTYSDNELTRAQYPFAFRYTVTYTLRGNTLDHKFLVENTGDEVLPFGIGGHPGFNIPLEAGTTFTDYYIEFSDICPARKLILTETCFMTDETEPFPLENGKIYRLHHDMFDNDAIFLRDMATSVTLKSDKTTKAVTVSYTNMPYLGLWHKPKTEAPYMCIEPWNGLPADDGIVDDMATKKYMNRIRPGESAEFGMSITIHK